MVILDHLMSHLGYQAVTGAVQDSAQYPGSGG
jgi:hypothetical protein